MPSERQPRPYIQRIEDILQSIADIRSFVAGHDYADFLSNKMVRYAVTRGLEIISEASRHLPSDLKARHPQIDWRGIAASGNVYRHGYDGVDDAFVWDVVVRDLVPLQAVLEQERDR